MYFYDLIGNKRPRITDGNSFFMEMDTESISIRNISAGSRRSYGCGIVQLSLKTIALQIFYSLLAVQD